MRNVTAALFGALIVMSPLAAQQVAQKDTWQVDPPHSSAQFAIRHMGISTVRGAFTKVQGDVRYWADEPEKDAVDVTIDASSIDTRVEMRDKDLRGDHYFDVAKYPTIGFKSKKVVSDGPGKLSITGDLTMHGVTKETVLKVDELTKPVPDGRGKFHMGVSATAKVNRTDFGIGSASPMLGDEVTITIDAELVKPAPGPH